MELKRDPNDVYPQRRKFCASCGIWRQIHEFGVTDKRGYLRAYCTTCERIKARVRIGLKEQGKPYEPTTGSPYGRRRNEFCGGGHLMSGDNLYVSPSGRRGCRECRRINDRSPNAQERSRIYQEVQRREQGIPPRPLSNRYAPVRYGETLEVPVGPFRGWLLDLIESGGVGHAAALSGMGQRKIFAVVNERQTVHVDTVDAALTHEGSTFLFELYPELYAFDEVAA